MKEWAGERCGQLPSFIIRFASTGPLDISSDIRGCVHAGDDLFEGECCKYPVSGKCMVPTAFELTEYIMIRDGLCL